MKAKDIFGLIVRTVGFLLFIYSLWNLSYGLYMVLGLFSGQSGAGSALVYLTFGVPAAIVGILLMVLARPLVRLCYPDNKDDSDP